MTDHAGAPHATVIVVYETLSVRWYGRTDLAFGSAIYESKTVILLVWCGAFANEFLSRYKTQISFWWDASALVFRHMEPSVIVKAACLSSVPFLFDEICVQANKQNAERSALRSCTKRRCRGEYCCHTRKWTIANNTAPIHLIINITSTYSYVYTNTHTHTHTAHTHTHRSKCEACWPQASNPMPKKIGSVCFDAG